MRKNEEATKELSTVLVAVVETDVLGVKAYHARCLGCGWESRRFDHEATAVTHAQKHGAKCKEAK